MVVEDDIKVKKKEASIVHLIATHPSCCCHHYATKLMQHVFSSKQYKEKRIYCVAKFDDKKVFTWQNRNSNLYDTPDDRKRKIRLRMDDQSWFHGNLLFQFWSKLNWNNDHDRIDDINDLVYPGSFVVFMESYEIANFINIKPNDGLKVCKINSDIKTRLCYNKIEKAFQYYSQHYEWQDCPEQLLNQYSINLKEKVLKAGDKNESVLMTYSGRREESEEVIDGMELPIKYLQRSYPTANNCVWLAAALAIRSIDEEEGDYMIQKLNDSPSDFEWLKIFDNNKRKRKCKDSLSRKLRDGVMKYMVIRVKNVQNKYTINHILKESRDGIYVALLRSTIGECTHVIGINVSLRKIYDCMEEVELDLNYNSLSRCCGPGREIQRIEILGQLVLNPKYK